MFVSSKKLNFPSEMPMNKTMHLEGGWNEEKSTRNCQWKSMYLQIRILLTVLRNVGLFLFLLTDIDLALDLAFRFYV